ncbi:non-specific lipid transfer protein GPI-anchored 23-like [Miscanthus floridulus]|uniref:non-specific lipid transfer protein GPI-anchored 23-like n=1 Tax=Miscanthus floridulus TaxID=154761 RepID=UPI00345AA0B7
MATPKCMWFAFAVTFAVAVATLQPSAATRVLDVDQEAGSSPWPPVWCPWPLPLLPCVPGECVPGLPWLPPCNNSSSGGAPIVPHPPLPPLPCIPGLPRLPCLLPCNNDSSSSSGGGAGAPPSPVEPPQLAECRTSLSGLAPCADSLTNATSGSAYPAAACCDGLKSLVKDAPICLCHAMNGELGKVLSAPVLRLRVMALPRTCHVAVPFGTLRKCIRGPVPPMDAPSAPPAA